MGRGSTLLKQAAAEGKNSRVHTRQTPHNNQIIKVELIDETVKDSQPETKKLERPVMTGFEAVAGSQFTGTRGELRWV